MLTIDDDGVLHPMEELSYQRTFLEYIRPLQQARTEAFTLILCLKRTIGLNLSDHLLRMITLTQPRLVISDCYIKGENRARRLPQEAAACSTAYIEHTGEEEPENDRLLSIK